MHSKMLATTIWVLSMLRQAVLFAKNIPFLASAYHQYHWVAERTLPWHSRIKWLTITLRLT